MSVDKDTDVFMALHRPSGNPICEGDALMITDKKFHFDYILSPAEKRECVVIETGLGDVYFGMKAGGNYLFTPEAAAMFEEFAATVPFAIQSSRRAALAPAFGWTHAVYVGAR